mgnify:CR=1 FL=1
MDKDARRQSRKGTTATSLPPPAVAEAGKDTKGILGRTCFVGMRLLRRERSCPLWSGQGAEGTGDVKVTSAAEARQIEAKGMTEREFQKQVLELAHAYGWLVFHARPGMTSRVGRDGKPVWVTPMQGDPGFPDLVLARPDPKAPRLILAELKTARGRLTAAQQVWQEALGDAEHRDWEYYTWWPSQLDEIAGVLR